MVTNGLRGYQETPSGLVSYSLSQHRLSSIRRAIRRQLEVRAGELSRDFRSDSRFASVRSTTFGFMGIRVISFLEMRVGLLHDECKVD